jgi:hypothetical protein
VRSHDPTCDCPRCYPEDDCAGSERTREEMSALLHDWACAVLSEDRDEANAAYCALRALMERTGMDPDFGAGAPSRAQFFAYDMRTGQIA